MKKVFLLAPFLVLFFCAGCGRVGGEKMSLRQHTRDNFNEINDLMYYYYWKTGKLPDDLKELEDYNYYGFKLPVLDYWGKEFRYKKESASAAGGILRYQVISPGRDGRFDTHDDLVLDCELDTSLKKPAGIE